MDFWKMAYRNGWATLQDLEKAVSLGILTNEQKEEIVNQCNS